MKYKKCTDPRVFGFGIFLPKKYYFYILKYKKEVSPYVDWFVKKNYKYPINFMRPHITLKYLGYHSKYSNRQIEKLIPELSEIARKYLPMKITIRGLSIGTKYETAGILLNFKPKDKVRKFHQELIKTLKNKIDFFENMDLKNFEPHIVLGSGPKTKENLKRLREIEKKSRKDKKVELTLTDCYILFKNKGPRTIFKKLS
jgi:2'-5' RNA ligase